MASERYVRLRPSSNATLALSVHNALGVSLQQSSDANLFEVWRCENLGDKKGFVLVYQTSNQALTWKQSGHKVRMEPYVAKAPTPQQVWDMTDISDSLTSAKKISPFQDRSICLDIKTGSVLGAEIFATPWKGSVTQQWLAVDLPHGSLYPPPTTTHAEIECDSQLFLTTLSQLHSYLGNALKIPLIGGKELDLHLLYKEVTKKGGLNKVTVSKGWKDVAKAFRLPPTITSASFILRKYYTLLLHHYEQLYFFGARGPLITPLSIVSSPLPHEPPVARIQPEIFGIDMQLTSETDVRKLGKRGRPVDEPEMGAFQDPQRVLGQTVNGTIHGKFDLGYFVSVQVGPETLKGILYHPPKLASPHPHSILEPKAISDFLSQQRIHIPLPELQPQRKDEKSPYTFFFNEWRDRLKDMNPDATMDECAHWLSEQWKTLPPSIKKNYEDMAAREKLPQQVQLTFPPLFRPSDNVVSSEGRTKKSRKKSVGSAVVPNGEHRKASRKKQPITSKLKKSNPEDMGTAPQEESRRDLNLV